MKIINYFIKLSLIIIVLVVAKSSTNVATTKVENDNINKTINANDIFMRRFLILWNIKNPLLNFIFGGFF